MNDFLKWTLRNAAIAVFWVFIFSINVQNRALFYYANDILVQNVVVETIDEQLTVLWDKVWDTAKITFKSLSESTDKA